MRGQMVRRNKLLAVSPKKIVHRDVTKFEFKFNNVQTLNVFNRFETQKCFKRFVVECEYVEKSLFYD